MAIECPLDEVVLIDVITSSATTGAATDADSTPTFAVYEETTDTDIGVGGNFTKRTSLTGNYRAQFTASAANGFELGKFYSVIASATVGAIAGKCVVRTFRVVAAESVAGYPKTDTSLLGGVAQSATDLKDFADTGYDPSAHKVAGVVLADTVTTYTGNTPQTGDSFARLGAPAGASVSADIAAIEAQTDDIGTAGAGLSAIPWNAAWDAEVQSEVADALAVYDPPTKAELDSAVAPLALEASVQTLDDYVDLEVAAIKAKTDNLPADPADASDIASSFSSIASTLSTIGGYVDTEVAAIKAKTDLIPGSPAAVGDIPTTAQIADKILGRNLAGGSDGGRTVTDSLRVSRNKVVISGTTITVYAEDDATVAWTGTLTTDAAAEPITSLDPA